VQKIGITQILDRKTELLIGVRRVLAVRKSPP